MLVGGGGDHKVRFKTNKYIMATAQVQYLSTMSQK